MELKVNCNLVKSERKKRAWSQNHLADVTDLGIRTIQRIEKTGSASYESIRALASAFSLEIEDLSVSQGKLQFSSICRSKLGMKKMSAGFAAFAMVVTAALFVSSATWAEQIMIDVGISQNNEAMTMGQLLTAEGKYAEIQVDNVIRVVISPSIQKNGRVFLSVQIHEIIDGEFVLLSEPKLITADHKEAEIRVESEFGNSFRILIAPHAGGQLSDGQNNR